MPQTTDLYVQRCLEDGPILMWRLDAAVGTGGTYSDVSGNNNNAVQGGTTLTTVLDGPLGGSGGVRFSATSNTIADSSVTGLVPARVTTEAFVRVNSAGNWPNFINHDWVGDGWLLYSNTVQYVFGVGKAVSQSNVTAPLNLGKWVHLVGTYDGTNTRIYVDGVLKATGTPAVVDSWATDIIGQVAIAGSINADFDIALVAVYPFALSSAQVADHASFMNYSSPAWSASPGILTLPAGSPELDGLFIVNWQGNDAIVLNGRNAPHNYSAAQTVGSYDRAFAEIYRILGIDGLFDAEVVDSRDQGSEIGEEPYRANYAGRNIAFTGRIEAYNLARLREMENAMKRSLINPYANFASFYSQPIVLKYLTPDFDSLNPGTAGVIKTAEISGTCVDLQFDHTWKRPDFFMDFQFTLRCLDPRWLVPSRDFTEVTVVNVNTSTVLTNHGNVSMEPTWYFGDYQGAGGGLNWSTSAAGITIENQTTGEKAKVDVATSGVQGQYFTLNSRSKRITSSIGISMLQNVSPIIYPNPWITLAPGSNTILVTTTVNTGAPKMAVVLQHPFV